MKEWFDGIVAAADTSRVDISLVIVRLDVPHNADIGPFTTKR